MNRPVIPIAEITPATRGWTTKVLLARKLCPRQAQTGKKYQRLLFIDKDETQVAAIIYGADITAMEPALQLQQTYYISNAKLQFIEPQYRLVPCIYQWIIGRTTAILHEPIEFLPRELGAPHFTKFADIPPLANTKAMIDILAIVIDALEPKTVNPNPKFGSSTVQELIVINDEKVPLLLSLWNEVILTKGAALHNTTERMPIISATRLLVTNYRGASLSAKGSANIVVSPPYPETQHLRAWRAKNHAFLHELVRERTYLQRPTPQLIVPRDNFSSVANVITNTTDDRFWVKVQLTITDEAQKFWYMSCNGCLKGTTGQYGWNIRCNFCHGKTVAKPRTKFAITVSDTLTPLDVVLFGELAESVIGLTASDLMQLDEEGKKPNFLDINKHLEHKEFVVHIRKKMTESHFGLEYRYMVISLVQSDQLPIPAEPGESSSYYSSAQHDSEASQHTQPEHPPA